MCVYSSQTFHHIKKQLGKFAPHPFSTLFPPFQIGMNWCSCQLMMRRPVECESFSVWSYLRVAVASLINVSTAPPATEVTWMMSPAPKAVSYHEWGHNHGLQAPHLQVPVLPSASQLLPLPLLLCTACTTMKLFFNAGLHETNASSTFPSLHAMPMLAS